MKFYMIGALIMAVLIAPMDRNIQDKVVGVTFWPVIYVVWMVQAATNEPEDVNP